jgi:hypothetical protein
METILKTLPFLSDLLDCIPSNIFVFDKGVKVVYCNRASTEFTGNEPKANFQKSCGEAINCLNSLADGLECGNTKFCDDCVLRKCILKAFNGEKTFKANTDIRVVKNGEVSKKPLKVSTFPLNHEYKSYVLAIIEDMSELEQLRELLPICAWCKKIKDDNEYWLHLEDYMKNHMDILLTHGICPDCEKKYFGDVSEGVRETD